MREVFPYRLLVELAWGRCRTAVCDWFAGVSIGRCEWESTLSGQGAMLKSSVDHNG